MSQQYVYNGTVVQMTGRRARKKETASTTTRRRITTTDELFEVTPVNNEEGSWKKWVRMGDLYTIVEDDSNE